MICQTPHGGLTDWEEIAIDEIIDIINLKKRQYKWLNYEYLIEINITINGETFEKYELIDNHSTRKEMQEFCDLYNKWKDYEQGINPVHILFVMSAERDFLLTKNLQKIHNLNLKFILYS